jgi:hypothetical protein
MKILTILAAAMALTATPALAQTAAEYNDHGVAYCQIRGATLLAHPDGYQLNFVLRMEADLSRASFAGGPGMFADTPELAMFFNGSVDGNGQASEETSPFAVTAQFNFFADGRETGAADTLRLGIDAGTAKSPPLTISTMSRDAGRISATLVEEGAALDGNDVTVPHQNLATLTEAALANGVTLTIDNKGKRIASVPVPAGSVRADRAAAFAWARRAYPLLRKGQCPN